MPTQRGRWPSVRPLLGEVWNRCWSVERHSHRAPLGLNPESPRQVATLASGSRAPSSAEVLRNGGLSIKSPHRKARLPSGPTPWPHQDLQTRCESRSWASLGTGPNKSLIVPLYKTPFLGQ